MSLIMTSGDYGAGCQRSKFSPYFPASSPYVTSVGATQIQRHAETAFYISGGEFVYLIYYIYLFIHSQFLSVCLSVCKVDTFQNANQT